MRIFLTGATGYIGAAVAQALASRGHSVVGLCRSERASQRLLISNAEAVIGDLSAPEAWVEALRNVDGVIHAGASPGRGMGEVDGRAASAMLSALAGSNRPFIYTSGTLVYGSTGDASVNENYPRTPLPLVQWRLGVENSVLQAAKNRQSVMIIRPSWVYGEDGGYLATLAQGVMRKKRLQIVGDGENWWSFVHVADLAELYALAVENASPGLVLNAADATPLRYKDVSQRICDAAGINGFNLWPLSEAREKLGTFADALAASQRINADRARLVLNWRPRESAVLGD